MVPRVSILIPTLDGEAHLARSLPVLGEQQLDGGFELRAIDSSSTDGTRALLEAAGARVETISRAEFRHGATRNALARGAQGELLVFLSQDACPLGSDFLARLIEPFADPRVAGVTCRVLPHADDDPLTVRTVLAAPEAREGAQPEPLGSRGLRFNNVASCVRASVFATLPFPDVDFGEDEAWAREALAAGWLLVHQPAAVVRHAHRYSPREAYRRYKIDARFQREHHGRRVRPGLGSVLKGLAHEVREDVRFVRRRGGALHLLRSPFLRGAQVLGQYVGGRG